MAQTAINVTINSNGWYSAHIPTLSISTQGSNRDNLLLNLKEAMQCYAESEKKLKHSMTLAPLFYLDFSQSLYASHL